MTREIDTHSRWFGRFMLLLLLCTCLLSCQEGRNRQASQPAVTMQSSTDESPQENAEVHMEYSTSYGPRELSTIDFKGLYGRLPSALDIGRSGAYVFFKLMLSEGEHVIYSAHLHDGIADEPQEIARGAEYNIAYIAAHPTANECLVTTSFMADDGHVHNRVFRVGPGMALELPYEECPGFPTVHHPESLSNLKPFYSWDGTQVIVPTDYFGVGLLSREGDTLNYAALPDPKIIVTGSQCGVLPDSGLGRQIYFSVWDARSRDEKCRIFSLDLDSPTGYQLRTDQTWIVYRVSSPDLQFDPWILQGSRLPDYLEIKRQVKIARFDPQSGMTEEQALGGIAEFNLEMDSHGKRLAFMDRNKQALVLLELASGSTQTDTSWYSDDARLFFTNDDQDIYVWKNDILYKAFVR